MANFPFTPDTERTAIAIAYRPEGMIADRVLPRTPIGKRQFTYTVHDRESLTKIPDTRIGRRSSPNQVEFGAGDIEATVASYGLSTVIPNDDEANAPDGAKPSDTAVTSLMDLVALDRERRVAEKVFKAATYGNNTSAPDKKWNDYADSNPIANLTAARDACLKKPNKLVLGKEVWSVLSTHPRIVSAIRGITENGLIAEAMLAQMLGLDEIIVGETWHDAAPRGKGVSRTFLWGKCAAFMHVAQNPAVRGGVPTFGLTAEYQGRRVLRRDVTIGLDGGVEYLVGEDVCELVTAPDLGFLLTEVIA